MPATLLIVPGLRDHVEEHWQTLLAQQVEGARTVAPIGREDLRLAPRLAALEQEAAAILGPIVLVAHSGGVALVAHWALATQRIIHGALLAAPADLDTPLPAGYPDIEALRAGGWLPIPRQKLPFPSIVAASRNDPLAKYERVAEMARAWGAELEDIGAVGHLNPASGFGPWAGADPLIARLAGAAK